MITTINLESNFIVKSQIEYSQISKVRSNTKKVCNIRKRLFQSNRKVKQYDKHYASGYTKNEIEIQRFRRRTKNYV